MNPFRNFENILLQEAPGQLRLPWSKQRLQDKKKYMSKFKIYSKLVSFSGKTHKVSKQKLLKLPPKASFLLPHQWKLGGPIKLKAT